jgi:hypothetical protein
MRQSFILRMKEEPVPVVVPLLSESEIQTSLAAWEGWKKERELMHKSTDGVQEKIIDKLKAYRKSLADLREMRAELPLALAAILEERRKLSDAIGAWIDQQMKAYSTALSDRVKQQELLAAWKALKTEQTKLDIVNSPACKADRTTPALEWMESLDPFPLPDIPPLPKHIVFDFSAIFFTGNQAASALSIPILEPVQIALKIPAPPDPNSPESDADLPRLPDLPDVPHLPDPNRKPLTIEGPGDAPAPDTSFDIDAAITALQDLTQKLQLLRATYELKLWVKEKHPDLLCETFGKNGCVFPETRLWDVFMRIWSPIGAFLDPGLPPLPAPRVAVPPDPDSIAPACKEGDDDCVEKLIKKGLQITFPPSQSSDQSSLEGLRSQMRSLTIDDKGEWVKNGSPPMPPGYDVSGGPASVYESYPVPRAIILELSSSSSSS